MDWQQTRSDFDVTSTMLKSIANAMYIFWNYVYERELQFVNKISEIEPGTSVCHFTLNRGLNRFWRVHTRRAWYTPTHTHSHISCGVTSPRARVPRGVVLHNLRVVNSCWIFWKWLIIASEKGKPGWGSDRGGIIGLCQCWQTWHCARDKTVGCRQFISEIRADQDDLFWMWYLVTLFVRLYGDWSWRWISVLFVDRTLGTIVIWTGIHEPIIKRRDRPKPSLRLRRFLIGFGRWPAPNGVNLRPSGEPAGSPASGIHTAERTRYGRTSWLRPRLSGLGPPGSGLVSVLSGGISPVFHPGPSA